MLGNLRKLAQCPTKAEVRKYIKITKISGLNHLLDVVNEPLAVFHEVHRLDIDTIGFHSSFVLQNAREHLNLQHSQQNKGHTTTLVSLETT